MRLRLDNLRLSFTGQGEVRGFLFNQELFSPRGFLYRVSCEASTWYEVFLRKVSTWGLVYPGSKSFGIWAWTYFDKQKALSKFESL